MIDVETGSTNVYADLGYANAKEMAVKARLVSKMSDIIEERNWSQSRASEVLGISQPKLSGPLRGRFRGVSEAKLLDCLANLGRDVRIVVGPTRSGSETGSISVEFA
jgi:predicted XRE-type DNA-binding protein